MTPRISGQLSERLDNAERTMRILWIALMGSVSVYGFVIYQLSRNGDRVASETILPPFVPPIVALSLAAVGTALFRTLSSPERMRTLLQNAGAYEAELQAWPEAERRLARVPPALFTLYILRWAIFESIAILGLVLGILQGSFETFVPYGLAAIALMAMTPPRIKSQVIEAIPLLPSDVRAGQL